MDVSFNNVVESTRQYFQGVPTPGGTGQPAGPGYGATPFWPPSYQQKQQPQQQQQQQQPQQQFQAPGRVASAEQQHLSSPRLPTLAPFSSIQYRGSGGTLPSMSSLKGGFEGASVPPRYPSPASSFASYFQQQHSSGKESQNPQHSPQPQGPSHPQVIQKHPGLQNHQLHMQNHQQMGQTQHSMQQLPQANHQSSQKHQIHHQSNQPAQSMSHGSHLPSGIQSHLQSNQRQPSTSQSSHQNSSNQSHQQSYHTHQSLQNHSQILQAQQNHKQTLHNHKLQQHLLQNHQSIQSLQAQGQHHQYQNHQQNLQNHHSHQLAMSKYQSHHQSLQNLHQNQHLNSQNHISPHQPVINHIPPTSQHQSHYQQNQNLSQSTLMRQSPHASSQLQSLTRLSPHLTNHHQIPSPSMHHSSTHQQGLTRQSPHLSNHQQAMSRQSPLMVPHHPNLPSPSSHLNHQQILSRQSPLTPTHRQPSPSPHLPGSHVPQLPTTQSNNQQNLFATPATPVSGSRSTPQPVAITTTSSSSSVTSVINHVKRESPLDLSVKTIRQSADSTADQEQVYYTFHNEFLRGKAQGARGSGLNQQSSTSRVQISGSSAPRVDLQFPPSGSSSSSGLNSVDTKKNKEPFYSLPSVNSFSKTYEKVYHQQHQQIPQHQHQQQPMQPQQPIPRSVFPTDPKYPQNYLKRPSDPIDKQQLAATKMARIDTWKQTIDQQIEKRFNSYLSQKAVNGDEKPTIPSGPYNSHELKQNGADKRVLSILRNSLETREARNQQVQQQKPQIVPKFESRFPSMPHRQNLPPFGAINLDRTTFSRLHVPRAVDSLQPEQRHPGLVQDVVDITDDDEPLQQPPSGQPNSKGELDGLAAFLAARIRTKAELKQQVTPKENSKAPTPTPGSSGGEQSSPRSTPSFSSSFDKDLVRSITSQDGNSIGTSGNKNFAWGSHHRILKENSLLSTIPRRRPCPVAATPEHRSSSETSVFDFRDSDSEGVDVPLSDLRRGGHHAPSLPSIPPPPPVEIKPEEEEEFKKWIEICEDFMVQLQDCDNKGMRKKMKVKLEDGIVIKEEIFDMDDDVPVRTLVEERRITEDNHIIRPQSLMRDTQSVVKKPRQPRKPGPRKRKLKAIGRGWQEEIWQFKRSLQMPGLMARPKGWPKPPGSLPDLERLRNLPQEPQSEPDEDRNSITKVLSEEKSFLDRLMQRYSDRKKKAKKFDDKDPQSSADVISSPKSCETDPKKETIVGYRDDLPAEGDLPPDLKPKSNISLQQNIYEQERPASAPPLGVSKVELRRNCAIKKSKLLKNNKDLLSRKGDSPRLLPEKRFKTFRRKLKGSSGFDYIRKKKKTIVRKEGDGLPRERKKPKTAPMTEQEIQAEIKGWVLNKGIGETLLHRAAKGGNVDVVHYCLDKLHHNPAPRDNAGYTPLHVASSRGHYQVANLLLKYGADVSDCALGGIRPLHEAVENGFIKIIKLLLEHGADPLLANYSGSTPLSMATDDEARHLMELHIANRPPPEIKKEEEEEDPAASSQATIQPIEEADPGSSSDLDGFEIEESTFPLPNLYRLSSEPRSDSWVLFHELSPHLKVKTKEALLKQLGQDAKVVFRDLRLSEFYEKAQCRAIKSSAGPKTPKVTLVKYTDTVKFLLGVETTIIPR